MSVASVPHIGGVCAPRAARAGSLAMRRDERAPVVDARSLSRGSNRGRRSLVVSSALEGLGDALVGGVLLLGLARSGNTYASRRDAGWAGPKEEFSDEEEERDDAGLRWTVASVVGCIPPLAWLSWLLPVISVGAWDADTRPGTIQKNDAYALAAAYFVAYATHGFNPADGFTWLVTLLCAAHVQLEKTNALMIGPDGDGVAQTQGDDVLTNLYKSIDGLTKTTTVTAEDLKTPRNSVEAAAKIGRAIGKAGVAAKQLGESISDGKLQAEIERAELDAEETVQRQSKELEDWDKRFTSKNDDSV